MKRIALVGNPNSGKSTLFNGLTGSTQFVGNWPGVTVEKKAGKTKINGETVEVIDLPGIYSLSPYSQEEIITRDYILKEKPDLVIDIIDASNLERNLYLTTQIMELGVPVVAALNMIDIVNKKGEVISAAALEKELDCPVCEISAISNKGVDKLKKVVDEQLKVSAVHNHNFEYAADIEEAIKNVAAALEEEEVVIPMGSTEFAALKLLSNDTSVLAKNAVPGVVWDKAEALRTEIEKKYDDDFESVIAEQRYTWIKSIIDKVITTRRKEKLSISDKIDRVVTNRFLALPIFFAIIYGIYWMCLNPNGLGKKLVGITFTWVINAMIWTAGALTDIGCAPWLVSLISDGCIFGIGIVVAFIPYLMVLFVFLAILEECGYMARVTFIMDRVFRRFGLSGKSFIPMLLGTGCTVQAVAAARTIENENDRKMTIFLTPFMPCATKMPVIILVAGLFTTNAAIAPLCYLFEIALIIICGIILKRTKTFAGDPAPFVMELPEYKIPRIKNIVHFVWDKTVSFFRKASSIIFVTTVIIWFFKYFGIYLTPVESIDDSILAAIGRALTPLFVPLGIGAWQLVAAMLTGYVAKDNVIATLGLIYGTELVSEGLKGVLTPASAVSFILFFMISSPCFASMGAMRKELGSAKLTAKAIAFQCSVAYVVALVAYQLLRFVL